jgi:anaerobic magnesium-protoporphyrin IX monomethyl ester cyclase
MKVLLVYKSHAEGGKDPYTSLLPIGLGYINALLRANGIRSRLANLSSYSWQETAALFRAELPDIVGISQFTHNRHDSLQLAAAAKKAYPDCFVVLGGPHATHRPQEILAGNAQVDAVVLGEGEATFLDLINCLASKGRVGLEQVRGIALRGRAAVVTTAVRPPIPDLDSLPFPALFYQDALGVDLPRQLEFIITSRGCPATCRFCSSPQFWGKTLRFRSPRSMVDEIRYIRDRHGLLYFSIRDDTFTADRARIMAFCRLLLDEKVYILWNCQSRVTAVDEEMLAWMKRAGCECVQFGVESGSPGVLRRLGKRITPEQIRKASRAVREAGIHLSVYLISGTPGETDEDIQATLGLIDAISAHDGQVSPLVYYPGTALFAEAVRSGEIDKDLLERNESVAFPVRNDSFSERSAGKLLKALARAAGKSRFTTAQFRVQKKLLGYCYTTNVIAGDQYAEMGNWSQAEREYREIVSLEPENPWGWLCLGDLLGRTGDIDGAMAAFRKVIMLTPLHAPAYSALGDLCRVAGDRQKALEYYGKALQLHPMDETAREGMMILSKL